MSVKDFFISYNRHDRQWAEWIAWTLEEAGYTVVVEVWDFRPGGNFALYMDRAVREAKQTIAVLSEHFLKANYVHPEWAAAFAQDPQGLKRTLIPVRVSECKPEGLQQQLVYVDLVGVPEAEARQWLLDGLKERAKPNQKPSFPGAVVPQGERVEPEPVAFPPTEGAKAEDARAGAEQTSEEFYEALNEALNEAFNAPPEAPLKPLYIDELKRLQAQDAQIRAIVERLQRKRESQQEEATGTAEETLEALNESLERLFAEPQLRQRPQPESKPSQSVPQSESSQTGPTMPALTTFVFEVVTVNAHQEISRKQGQAQSFTEDLGNGVGLEMVLIPAGHFPMGSPVGEKDRLASEGPQRQVRLNRFLMGKYPVTQTQWRVVAALPKLRYHLELDPSRVKAANNPIEEVSWNEAVEFCDRLSQKTGRKYRLPSEAEWEYACRAGTTTPFHFGETLTTDLANYGHKRKQTTYVGKFSPSAFGLYDMHGNVWEWCADHWHDNYQGALADGSVWVTGGDSKRRVRRGGSWISYPRDCRSAYRTADAPPFCNDAVGFRIVCSTPGTL